MAACLAPSPSASSSVSPPATLLGTYKERFDARCKNQGRWHSIRQVWTSKETQKEERRLEKARAWIETLNGFESKAVRFKSEEAKKAIKPQGLDEALQKVDKLIGKLTRPVFTGSGPPSDYTQLQRHAAAIHQRYGLEEEASEAQIAELLELFSDWRPKSGPIDQYTGIDMPKDVEKRIKALGKSAKTAQGLIDNEEWREFCFSWIAFHHCPAPVYIEAPRKSDLLRIHLISRRIGRLGHELKFVRERREDGEFEEVLKTRIDGTMQRIQSLDDKSTIGDETYTFKRILEIFNERKYGVPKEALEVLPGKGICKFDSYNCHRLMPDLEDELWDKENISFDEILTLMGKLKGIYPSKTPSEIQERFLQYVPATDGQPEHIKPLEFERGKKQVSTVLAVTSESNDFQALGTHGFSVLLVYDGEDKVYLLPVGKFTRDYPRNNVPLKDFCSQSLLLRPLQFILWIIESLTGFKPTISQKTQLFLSGCATEPGRFMAYDENTLDPNRKKLFMASAPTEDFTVAKRWLYWFKFHAVEAEKDGVAFNFWAAQCIRGAYNQIAYAEGKDDSGEDKYKLPKPIISCLDERINNPIGGAARVANYVLPFFVISSILNVGSWFLGGWQSMKVTELDSDGNPQEIEHAVYTDKDWYEKKLIWTPAFYFDWVRKLFEKFPENFPEIESGGDQ